MSRAVLTWLVHHPFPAAGIAMATLVAMVLAWSGITGTETSSSRHPVEVNAAEATLPAPTQFPPRSRVAAAHRALHAMGRVCGRTSDSRELGRPLHPVRVIEQFARDYPNGGFISDGESGTSLAMLVVLRFELQTCAPLLVPGVEELLPRRFREPGAG